MFMERPRGRTLAPLPQREPAGAPLRLTTDRALPWLLAAAVVLPLGLTAMSAWHAWRHAWREAEAEVSRTAEAGAEYARRLFDGMVLRLDRAAELLAGLSDAEIRARERELHEAL